MYKILRPIKANTHLATEPKFNAQDIYDFLLSIEELKNRKIQDEEIDGNTYEFVIGNNVYTLSDD